MSCCQASCGLHTLQAVRAWRRGGLLSSHSRPARSFLEVRLVVRWLSAGQGWSRCAPVGRQSTWHLGRKMPPSLSPCLAALGSQALRSSA